MLSSFFRSGAGGSDARKNTCRVLGIGCGLRIGVGGDRVFQVGGLQQEHLGGKTALVLDGLADAPRKLRGIPFGGLKNDVAALDVSLDILQAQSGEQFHQLAHGQRTVAADVDPAKEGNILIHYLSYGVWPDFNAPRRINFQAQALGLTQAKFAHKLKISADLLVGVADAII